MGEGRERLLTYTFKELYYLSLENYDLENIQFGQGNLRTGQMFPNLATRSRANR